MSPHIRDTKHRAKARQRRRRTAQERLARDRSKAQHTAEALQQGYAQSSCKKLQAQ